MGQSAIILVISAALVAALVLFAMQRNTRDADVELAGYHYKVLAREAASTGLNMAVRKLVNDAEDWQANTAQYQIPSTAYRSGSYSVVVTAVHPDTVDVVSTGLDGPATHIIEARYAKGLINLGVPPGLLYAIFSEDELTLNGQAEIIAVNDEVNASIHTNGTLTSNGRGVDVEGYGTYGPDGSGTVNPEKAIDEVFHPNNDENGELDNMYQGDLVDVPDFVAADYLPYATYVTAGDTTLSGVIDFETWGADLGVVGAGTADNPFLLYINGSLSISGDVSLLGYVQVVATGTITISGNVTATVTPPPDKAAPEADWDAWVQLNLDAAGENQIGFFAEDDIISNGGNTIVGQLYTNTEVVLNGGGGEATNVIGGITSTTTDINVNGGVVIRYASVSETVLLPGWEYIVPEGVRLIAYAEW